MNKIVDALAWKFMYETLFGELITIFLGKKEYFSHQKIKT